MFRPTRRPRPRPRGFTLPEVLAASAVLALAIAAIAQAISAGQKTTFAALDELRAHALAEALIEEIIAKPYTDAEGATDLGPDDGETNRAAFDNSDDYHGFSESAGAIADAAGVAYPQTYQTFARSVAAQYTTQTVTGFSQTLNGLEVTVTVTGPNGQTWTFTRFIPEDVGGS